MGLDIDKVQFAISLAKKLDTKDGSSDNHISASVWNDFTKANKFNNSNPPVNYMCVFNESTGKVDKSKNGDGVNSLVKYLNNCSDAQIKSMAKTYGISVPTTTTTQSASKAEAGSTPHSQLVAKVKNHPALKIKSGVVLDNLKTATLNKILEMADFLQNEGKKGTINSAYRTTAKQDSLLRKETPATADTPAHSQHTKGNAFDMHISPSAGKDYYIKLARKVGICNGRDTKYFDDVPANGTEYWHFQLTNGDGHLFDESLRAKHPYTSKK